MFTANNPRMPKYAALLQSLRSDIQRGTYRPGDRLPTVAELRNRFGVSNFTVSQAYFMLEQDGLVRRSQGSGVFVAETPVNPVASRPERNGTIGFFQDKTAQIVEYPYWAHLLEGAQSAAAAAGMEVLLFNPRADEIHWEKVDGVLATADDLSEMRRHMPLTLPCVSLVHRARNVSSVVADDEDGTMAATRHLVELGHRRIAYLQMGGTGEMGMLRLAGYHAGLSSAGIAPQSAWVRDLRQGHEEVTDFEVLGSERMRDWLRQDWHEQGCTALVCQNDNTAIGAIQALREADLRVPQDVSVVGFDGTPLARYFSPRLTTIEVPLQRIGGLGVQRLLRQMKSTDAEAHTDVLPVHLAIGQSSGPPPRGLLRQEDISPGRTAGPMTGDTSEV